MSYEIVANISDVSVSPGPLRELLDDPAIIYGTSAPLMERFPAVIDNIDSFSITLTFREVYTPDEGSVVIEPADFTGASYYLLSQGYSIEPDGGSKVSIRPKNSWGVRNITIEQIASDSVRVYGRYVNAFPEKFMEYLSNENELKIAEEDDGINEISDHYGMTLYHPSIRLFMEVLYTFSAEGPNESGSIEFAQTVANDWEMARARLLQLINSEKSLNP